MDEPVQAARNGRRERRRHETRERLYQSAMRLLSERDFNEVTVEMITEAADVGKGTFFNYFPNKEAIVSYRYERKFELLAELLGKRKEEGREVRKEGRREEEKEEASYACDSALNTHHLTSSPFSSSCLASFPHAGPVWQRIVATMHHMGEDDAQSKRLARNLLALGLVNDMVRAAGLSVHTRVCEIAEALIEEGQAGGEIRSDLSSRALGDYIRSVYLNALYLWAESDEEESLHAVLDRTLVFAWRSIRHAA